MDIKKTPYRATLAVVLSGLLLAACDDTRVRISGETGPRLYSSGGYFTYTPQRYRVSFDADLGMYVVLDLIDTYWNDGYYYRYRNHRWHRSPDCRRWSRLRRHHVPSHLYRRHYSPERHHDRIRITRTRRHHSSVRRHH